MIREIQFLYSIRVEKIIPLMGIRTRAESIYILADETSILSHTYDLLANNLKFSILANTDS
jgi:hypothetical protein